MILFERISLLYITYLHTYLVPIMHQIWPWKRYFRFWLYHKLVIIFINFNILICRIMYINRKFIIRVCIHFSYLIHRRMILLNNLHFQVLKIPMINLLGSPIFKFHRKSYRHQLTHWLIKSKQLWMLLTFRWIMCS